jgi:hypothetical protein
MRKSLRLDSLGLGVLLLVGTSACAPAALEAPAPTQTTPPIVTSAPSPVAKASAAASPAATPVARISPSPSVAVASFSAAASPSPSASAATAAPRPANASLLFTAPTAGETVSAGSVTVIVNYTGPQLVDAANATKLDDYHIAYLLDVDPNPYIGTTVPIPTGDPRIIHAATTSTTFNNVAVGTHTLAVVMVGSNHVSVNPSLADKETVTAR